MGNKINGENNRNVNTIRHGTFRAPAYLCYFILWFLVRTEQERMFIRPKGHVSKWWCCASLSIDTQYIELHNWLFVKLFAEAGQLNQTSGIRIAWRSGNSPSESNWTRLGQRMIESTHDKKYCIIMPALLSFVPLLVVALSKLEYMFNTPDPCSTGYDDSISLLWCGFIGRLRSPELVGE